MLLLSSLLPFLVPLLVLPTTALGAMGYIETDAVSYCAEAKAVIVDEFEIAYFQANKSVAFSFSLASVESNLNVSANIYLNAYGIQVINETLDLCSYFEGVLCPLPQVNFTGYGTYPIPDTFIKQIPAIAFTVPNLEAYARIQLISDDTGEVAACIQTTLTNGKTTRHKGVAIATGVFTALALLIGIIHAVAVSSPSPAQYRWFDILFLFQTAAATGFLHLNYPLVYSNFVDNFAWSFGLFRSSAMQNTINKMRYKTGGTLSGDAYSDVQYINRQLSPYNFINLNSLDSVPAFKSFIANASTSHMQSQSLATIPSSVETNATTDLSTGLPVYVESLGIPEANAFDTAFFWFLAFIAIAVAFHVLLFAIVFIVDRVKDRRGSWASRTRRMWWDFCSGNALRLCLIGFLPMWIFGFWQFNIGDSKLSIFFAVFGILITAVPLLTSFVLTIIKGRQPSSTAPNTSPLYTSYRWFHSVGVLYRPYRQRFHFFWFAPLVLAMVARAAFIAFGGASGWVQVIGNIVIEAVVFVSLLACRPHKDRKGDWLAPFLSLMRLIAFGLLIAFIPSVGVKALIRTIIGFVLIVVFGIPAILLFLGLIWNAGYGWLWKRHVYKIEDGLEVERFAANDYDSDSDRQAMQHMDAATFVTAAGAQASRSATDSGPSLGRRTSIIDPVGDNVYEPSLSSHRYPSDRSDPHSMTPLSPNTSPNIPTPAYRRVHSSLAYEKAASGGGVHDEDLDQTSGRATSPAMSGSGRPVSRSSQFHSSGNGMTSPISGITRSNNGITSPTDDRRWSRDQYYIKERY